MDQKLKELRQRLDSYKGIFDGDSGAQTLDKFRELERLMLDTLDLILTKKAGQ